MASTKINYSDPVMAPPPEVKSASSVKDMDLKDLISDKFSNTGVMLWQIGLAVEKYRGYPTETIIDFNRTVQLDFPAVTFCNLNPLRQNGLESSAASGLKSVLEKEWDSWGTEDVGKNASKPADFNDWGTTNVEPSYGGTTNTKTRKKRSASGEEKDSDYEFKSDMLSRTSELGRTERMQMGHNLTTMLTGCSFAGVSCSPADFKAFNNYLYGNCYTFNSGAANSTIRGVNKIGPLYGLSLEIFIQQNEYVAGLADAAGIRIVIHNQTSMPFPEDNGFNLAPGTRTSIGIKQVTMTRSVPKWGKCHTHSQDENEEKNAYLMEYGFINYTTAACAKTCFQKHLIKDCNCYDPNYPYNRDPDRNVKAFEGLSTTLEPCDKSGGNYSECNDVINDKFVNNSLGCVEECPPPCFETQYTAESSFAYWPANVGQDRLLDQVARKSEYFWNAFENMAWDPVMMNNYISTNFLKVEVYYRDMTVENIVTKPSYLALDLISDLGGQAGLWVGVSMIAIFEIVELFVDLSIICIKRARENRVQVIKKNSSDKKGPFPPPPSYDMD